MASRPNGRPLVGRHMGLIKIIISAVIAVVVLLGAVGGIMYATDTPVKATIIEKQCGTQVFQDGANSAVTVKTKFPVPGIVYTLEDFSDRQCSVLEAGEDGNYVEYYIKSGRVTFYEAEGGVCIYDSVNGVGC